MAEWRQTRHRGGSFSVIGQPFAFVPHSPHGEKPRVLRCHPDWDLQSAHPKADSEFYDLVELFTGDDDEVFEDGWYLSGIGHHLEWCGAVLEDAVDAAQEAIAWDGRNAHNLPLPGIPEYRVHALPVPDYIWDADPYFGILIGKRKDR